MSQPWLLAAGAALLGLLVLWVAWKIGRLVLRLAAGLAMLGLIGLILWYLFLR